MLVEGQGKVFLLTMGIGGLAGFLYDSYRVLRVRTNLGGVMGALGDLTFWAVTVAAVFGLLLQVNQGEVRLYVLLGLLGGALVYFGLVSPYAFRLVDFGWHLAGKVEDLLFALLEQTVRIALFPVRKSVILIWWPLKLTYSGSRYLGRTGAGEMRRTGGVFLSALRMRAAGWKDLISHRKRN